MESLPSRSLVLLCFVYTSPTLHPINSIITTHCQCGDWFSNRRHFLYGASDQCRNEIHWSLTKEGGIGGNPCSRRVNSKDIEVPSYFTGSGTDISMFKN